MKPYLCLLISVMACGDDTSMDADGGAFDLGENDVGITTDGGPEGGGADTNPSDARPSDVSTADGGGVLGSVMFVPIYESGSAWDGHMEAHAMVDRVFLDFGSNLRTSGDWDAVIEVYLTDNNTANANTSFSEFRTVMVDGQSVRVVPAWAAIVQNSADEPASAEGEGAEFTIHFNVSTHADNDGLLRHEMMHGLGAVNALENMTVTTEGVFTGPAPGDRVPVALYDLQLVDLDGEPLVADYRPDGTFEVQAYRIETTLAEWMDGAGGISFRGAGGLVMSCGTFPLSGTRGAIMLNEPTELMSASAHPTWNTLAAPDYAFLRAMHYQVP